MWLLSRYSDPDGRQEETEIHGRRGVNYANLFVRYAL